MTDGKSDNSNGSPVIWLGGRFRYRVNYNYLWIIYTGHIKPTPSLHLGRNQIQKKSVTDGIHTGGYFWPSISVLNFVWLQDWPDFSDILEATGITSAFIRQKIKRQVQLLYGSFGSQTKRDGRKENVTDGTVWINYNFMPLTRQQMPFVGTVYTIINF